MTETFFQIYEVGVIRDELGPLRTYFYAVSVFSHHRINNNNN